MSRPNIILFVPDEMRSDALGHINSKGAITPNIDNLVQHDAISLNNAFCQNPLCAPSRCSFMTGWYPHTRGHRSFYYLLQPHEPMLLKTLKQQGYYVWWGGKNDLIPGQNDNTEYYHHHNVVSVERQDTKKATQSFYGGEIQGESHSCSDAKQVLAAIDMITNYSDTENPFCIYLPLNNPHPPYQVESPWYGKNSREKIDTIIPEPKNWDGKPRMVSQLHTKLGLQESTQTEWQELRGTYYDMCTKVDDFFGQIITAIKERNLYKNTLIVLISDHGDYAGDYGLVEKSSNTFEDSITKVPCIIKPPSSVPIQPGNRDCLVELVDIPATIADICDIDLEYEHFGKSLCHLFTNPQEGHKKFVFCEGGRRHDEYSYEKAFASDGTWEWDTGNPYYPRVSIELGDSVAATRAIMIRNKQFKYVYRLYEQDELYHLTLDPQELNNVILDPTYRDNVQNMKESLLKHFVQTSDVIMHKKDERHI